MNALECLNAPFCARLALSLAHFLWEGAVIALAAWAVAAALRRHSPRARYGVYCLALGLMVCALAGTILLVEPPRSRNAAAPPISRRALALPAFTAAPSEERVLPPGRFAGPRNGLPAENTSIAPQDAGAAMKSRWESISAPLKWWWGAVWPVCAPYVSDAYLVGLLAMMLRLVAGLGGSGRLRRLSQPVDDASILQSLARQAQALGLHFTPPIAFCRRTVVPTVVGILRPTILLPFTFATGLSADQIEMLLAHELAHVRRYDPLVNVAQRLIEALLFFHPAMWFISRRIRIERELCCDDLVVALGGKPLEYASSLVETASRVRPSARPAFLPAEGLNAAASAVQLKSRVKRLLGAPEHEALRISRAWVVLCCVAAVVLLAGILSSGRTPAGEAKPDTPAPKTSETLVSDLVTTKEQQIQRSIARWDFTRAIPAAEALLKTANDDAARGRCRLLLAQAYGVWGVEYRDAVARDKGRRHLEQAFALNPALKNELDVARLRAYLLAYRQSSKANVNQALADAEKEIKSHPRDAQAHYSLGMLHHVLATEPEFAYTKPEQDEERRLALESMAKAVELDPKRYEYWSYYVSALAYAGRKEEAKKAADRMMKEADLSQDKIPPSATCAYEIMSALMEPEEGYAYVRAQAARDPSYAPLQFVAAERYDEKDPARYKMLTDLAARIASGDLRLPVWQARLELTVLYKLGELHYQAGEIEKALDVYDRIISLSPCYAEVRLNRGAVYMTLARKAGTPEEKARLLEKAKEDFEAQLQYPWHDRVADAHQYLDKTVKDLETLRAASPSKPTEAPSVPVGADSKWGSAVQGVRVRLKAEKSVWQADEQPVFKIDLKSEKERVLPHYGPPLDEFDVRLDGVWYRRNKSGERQENLRSVGPSPGTSRENLHFLLRPEFWCRSDDGITTMPSLAPGKHSLELALPLASADKVTTQPLRAVSNPVEIEIGSPTASAASGEPADKATTGSLADLPEFRDLDTSITEKTLQRMIAEKGLRSFWTLKDRVTKTYDHHVYRSDGENVVVTFRDGKCSGIRRMRKDASYADKLFNGLGKLAGSLQVTLRADKNTWKAGEDLALKADVRNAGQEDVAIYISGYDHWEIELDGQWYWPIGATTGMPVLLAPGEEVLDISVPPTWIKISPLDWYAKSDKNPVPGLGKLLTLEPGRHTFRVGTYPVMYSVDAEGRPLTQAPSPGSTRRVLRGERPTPGKPVRAVSNPIEIEVVVPSEVPSAPAAGNSNYERR